MYIESYRTRVTDVNLFSVKQIFVRETITVTIFERKKNTTKSLGQAETEDN